MSGIKTIVLAKIVGGGGGGGEAPVLVTKTVTDNGTYKASEDDADGYKSVTVAFPSGDDVRY